MRGNQLPNNCLRNAWTLTFINNEHEESRRNRFNRGPLVGVPRIVLKPKVDIVQSQDLEEAKAKKSRKKRRGKKKRRVSRNEEDSKVQDAYRTVNEGKPTFLFLFVHLCV